MNRTLITVALSMVEIKTEKCIKAVGHTLIKLTNMCTFDKRVDFSHIEIFSNSFLIISINFTANFDV